MENVVTQCHNAHTLYHSRKRPNGQSPFSPPKPRPNASTLMLQSGRACDWAERHHLEADPAGVKKCVMCTKEGKRFRCVTRCSRNSVETLTSAFSTLWRFITRPLLRTLTLAAPMRSAKCAAPPAREQKIFCSEKVAHYIENSFQIAKFSMSTTF